MSASYARLPDGCDDLGRSVLGRREWSFADCAGAHGRQIGRRSMHTDQHTDRGGIKAENSLALRAVLWYCQVLPQRRKGLRRRNSARRGEHSHPQPASSHEGIAVGTHEKQLSFSFDSRNRELAAGGEQAARKSTGLAGGGNCADGAQRDSGDRDASFRCWSRNRLLRRARHFTFSRLQCSSFRCSPNSNQKATKGKANWHGKET